MNQPIKTALLSVSDKTGIAEFAAGLAQHGVRLISTGGTATLLRDAGLDVADVSDVTNFPEMMDGRVKTLHPMVHGGILAVRDNAEHKAAMDAHAIGGIDLVVVNLYPFEQTVAKGGDYQACVENIDIGGPAMIRSAAKNHNDVTVVVNPARYDEVLTAVADGGTSLELRKALAAEAFSRTAAYDSAIQRWFAGQLDEAQPATYTFAGQRKQSLRYGENPHQSAALYITDDAAGVANAEQLQGKELSYNNIADTDAAYALVQEFAEPSVAIIKHANPCGVASAESLSAAYDAALACDPVSAYGGIHAFNRPVDAEVAAKLKDIFVEVVIAPDYDAEALEILSKKKNLRLLKTPNREGANAAQIKQVAGGFLLQSADDVILNEAELKVVTEREPSEQEMTDLRMAFTVCKHVKSNAIVLVKDGATVGIGAGQMSRVDSSRIAAWKAAETCTSVENAKGAVLASDAFFPFADGLENAAEHGVTAVIQPGGSIRDDEVIAAANKAGIAMVTTALRHFKH